MKRHKAHRKSGVMAPQQRAFRREARRYNTKAMRAWREELALIRLEEALDADDDAVELQGADFAAQAAKRAYSVMDRIGNAVTADAEE